MKSILFALAFASALLTYAAPPPNAAAQTAGPSASASYKFTSADGLTKYVEFDVKGDEKGSASGRLSFSGQIVMSEEDAEAAGDPRLAGTVTDFYMRADLFCLTVSKNRAVTVGSIVEASPKFYVGYRILIVVEDGGDTFGANDRLTWSLFRLQGGGWVPVDAERPDDIGATLTWLAKDAERADDAGIQQPSTSPVLSCQGFPLTSHTFVSVKYDSGQITVQP